MIFPFILLAVSLVLYIDKLPKIATRMDLPSDLQTWCPYTNFCNLSALKKIPEQQNKGNRRMKPCCKPCSCSEDCGLKRNCCSPRYDIHKMDETLGTICKSLNTKELIGRNDEHFHIIDKCPGQLDTCKNVKISIYGSFLPVLSRMNGMIYYNSYCASCHNQTDISKFIPSLSCPDITDDGLDELFNAIKGFNLNCFFDFLTPENVDISNQRCYPKLIRDCEFKTHEDIVNNCKSFNATFVSKSYWYQNVYCYLCGRMDRFPENKWSDEFTICPVSRNGRFQGISALTVLIDQKTADSFQQSVREKHNTKEICLKNQNSSKKVCRPILCPEGKFRVNGLCKFFGENWYVRNLVLFVNLTPISGKLTRSDLEDIPDAQLVAPQREYLYRPALKTWEMDLYYNLDQDGNRVRFLLVTLFLKNRMVKPHSLLSQIDQVLKKIWTLKINKKRFPLKADINKYRMYYLANDKKSYVPFAFENEISNDFRIHIWTKNFLNKFGSNMLVITKSFFCNQVVLEEGEFNHSNYFPEKVFITSNAKYLGNTEFKFISGTNELQNRIRVCYEDVFSESTGSQLSYGHGSNCLLSLLLFVSLAVATGLKRF